MILLPCFKPAFALSFVCAALSVAPSHAGPDDTSKWLIGDSVSMMDFGIFRINLLLEKGFFPVGGIARYDWDLNRIRIEKFVLSGKPNSVEKECAEWISEVRVLAGIALSDGQPYGAFSRFS